jgi:hypothetical protein
MLPGCGDPSSKEIAKRQARSARGQGVFGRGAQEADVWTATVNLRKL